MLSKMAHLLSLKILTGKSNVKKTPALTNSANIDIWIVDTSNELFIRGS